MARYCLDCFNRLEHAHYTEKDVRLSLQPEICEGCGEKHRIVNHFRRSERRGTPADWFRRPEK